MTIQTRPGNVEEKISEQDVADYLRQHPDFFDTQIPLLTELSLPHKVGGRVVSLVERQVLVLRENNKKLKKQLDDLVHIARDNDKLGRQINKLVLRIMAADSLAELFGLLQESLRRDFAADAVALRLMVGELDNVERMFPRNPQRNEWVDNPVEMRKLFEKFLKEARPVCGRLKQAQREFLFETMAQKVASVAMLPIVIDGQGMGLLAVGSCNEQRFRAGMGTAYLSHLSMFLSAIISKFLTNAVS